jgi:DNA repair exonuclease SbcCD nuclease subunit
MIKFLHCADIHLDSPLRGLESYDGAPVEEIRGATRKAFVNLINLALDEKVSFVLISGDLYDGDWKDYNTGLFLMAQLSKLSSQGIPVFIVKGNHDAESKMTRDLKPPEGIKVFSSSKPETITLKDLDVAIHGQSFATAAVTKDLASSYPPPWAGLFNIGMLHTSVNGREGHENYAPCSLDTLQAKGYDYWALGHVHKREILSENPWIVFPGNTQGRHIKETGPKGCTIVSVEDGAVVSVEHRDLHSLVWSLCEVEASGAAHPQDVVDRVKEWVEKEYLKNNKEFTAARIHVRGSCKAHGLISEDPEKWKNEMRAAVTDACGSSVWLEKIHIQTAVEADFEQIIKRNDALGDLLRYLESLEKGDSKDLLDLIHEDLTELRTKLPPELGQGIRDLDSKEKSLETIEGIKQLLISSLLLSGIEQ